MYPAYSSFKALEDEADHGRDQLSIWLVYWVVFSSFTIIEYSLSFLVRIIPLYYLAKLMFVIWLQFPVNPGSRLIYRRYIVPILKQHQSGIDRSLNILQTRANQQLNNFGLAVVTSSSATAGEGQVLSRRREAPAAETGPLAEA